MQAFWIRSVGYNRPILIDQGTADPFLAEQLLPDVFVRGDSRSAADLALPRGLQPQLLLHRHLVKDHIRHHAAALCG